MKNPYSILPTIPPTTCEKFTNEKVDSTKITRDDFPDDFLFGTGASSYQVCVDIQKH